MGNDAQKTASPRRTVKGLIAILDALGAATYTQPEIEQFLESRDQVLNKLAERAEAGKIDKKRLKVFTFNDTIVIVYLARQEVTLSDVATFCFRLRAFMMHSLQNHILFRGAVSVGSFYGVDDKTNTVMGPAVSDAAAWYDEADWIGINATPHASMFIDSLLERSDTSFDMVIVDYDVPLKDKQSVKVKVVNWPSGFYVPALTGEAKGGPRATLLTLLAEHQAPKGTESKYYNAIKFFDHVVDTQKLGKAERQSRPKQRPPLGRY